jgi:hypothetical protein
MMDKHLLLVAVLMCSFVALARNAWADAADDDKAAREVQKRIEEFQAELKKTKDPVALAVKMAKDPDSSCALVGMDVLVEHWQDPRAIKTLQQIADSDRHSVRDGLLTLAGQAAVRLDRALGRKEYEALMKGADKPGEKLARIREVFDKNPLWLDRNRRPHDKQTVVRLLIRSAEEAGGEKAIDLVVKSGLLTQEWARRHDEALLRYVKSLGCEKTLAIQGLLDRVLEGRAKDKASLLEAWLADATRENEIETLVQTLAGLPDGRDRLIKVLKDRRPAAIKRAAVILAYNFADQKSLDAIKETIERRKEEKASKEEMDFLTTLQRKLEKDLGPKKDGA